MTVRELNTLHTVCEVELLTILAMSVQNPNLLDFF